MTATAAFTSPSSAWGISAMSIDVKRGKPAVGDYGTLLHYRTGRDAHVVMWVENCYPEGNYRYFTNSLNNTTGDPSPTYALALKSCLEKLDVARTRTDR